MVFQIDIINYKYKCKSINMVNPENEFKREEPSQTDLETVQAQLGRAPRDVSAIAHRCPCGAPDVVETPPRLADGTPFPTFYLVFAFFGAKTRSNRRFLLIFS